MAEKEYAPKKMLTLHILDILKRFSDENHPLSQKQIQDILADENEKYRMSVDRKAIKRNLEELIKAGYDIRSEERTRGVPDRFRGLLSPHSVRSKGRPQQKARKAI